MRKTHFVPVWPTCTTRQPHVQHIRNPRADQAYPSRTARAGLTYDGNNKEPSGAGSSDYVPAHVAPDQSVIWVSASAPLPSGRPREGFADCIYPMLLTYRLDPLFSMLLVNVAAFTSRMLVYDWGKTRRLSTRTLRYTSSSYAAAWYCRIHVPRRRCWRSSWEI